MTDEEEIYTPGIQKLAGPAGERVLHLFEILPGFRRHERRVTCWCEPLMEGWSEHLGLLVFRHRLLQ